MSSELIKSKGSYYTSWRDYLPGFLGFFLYFPLTGFLRLLIIDLVIFFICK